MILFGHPLVESESLYHIGSVDALVHTPPNATIYVHFTDENVDIMKHLQSNAIDFAVEVADVRELVLANAFGASFLVVSTQFAQTAQQIAENYLFDAKVLAHVEDDETMQKMALMGIDGVLYPGSIVKISG